MTKFEQNVVQEDNVRGEIMNDNYYRLLEIQDALYDEVEPYIYMDGIEPKVSDDAPDDIKEKFKRMIDMNFEIQLAKAFA